MNEVVMLVGIMGSGKSTLAKTYEELGYVRLNRDEQCRKLSGLYPKLCQALGAGKSVILDNTFATIESRARFIDICKGAKVPVRCIYMDISLEDAQFNICWRICKINEETGSQNEKVYTGFVLNAEELKKHPNPGVFGPGIQYDYLKRFQMPSMAEGFSSIEIKNFVRELGPEYCNSAYIFDMNSFAGNKIEKISNKIKQLDGLLLGLMNIDGESIYSAIMRFDYLNAKLGVEIDYTFCKHVEGGCWCRMPHVFGGVMKIRKHKLLPSKCVFVGDSEIFAKNCGFKFKDINEFC